MKRGEARKLIAQAIAKGQYDDQIWRTINGTNVEFGEDGQIINGPDNLKDWAQNGGSSGKGGKGGLGGRQVVQGKDISKTYTGSTDIKSVLAAQGFNGLPKVESGEDFDNAVKESSFIAQRTYSASSEEVLQQYQDMLYDGDFYVDCSVGGSQYGQGMYCAADYNGELTEGIESEMEHYQSLGAQRALGDAVDRYAQGITTADINASAYMEYSQPLTDEEGRIFLKLKMGNYGGDKMLYYDLPENEQKICDKMMDSNQYQRATYALEDLVDNYMEEILSGDFKGYSITETFTLDKSANIITYDDLQSMKSNEKTAYKNMDDGAYAALKGYDAINAEHHGESGSYTVVLNRTKTILQDNRKITKAAGKMTFKPGKDGEMIAYKDGKEVGWVQVYGTGSKADQEALKNPKGGKKKMKKSEAQRLVNEAVEKAMGGGAERLDYN